MLLVDDDTNSESVAAPPPKNKFVTKKATGTSSKAEKEDKEKAAVKEGAKANGNASPAVKGRKVAPKSAERVEDSDEEDGNGEVEAKKAGTKSDAAESKTEKKMIIKAKPKSQSAQKANDA